MLHRMVRATLRFTASRRFLLVRERGFTLIELLVVTAIMILISGVVFANSNAFGGKVLLQNLAYDSALTVRQAQVYGISVQRFADDIFADGYGVRFTRNTNPTVQDQFVLFADVIDKNGLYDCSSALACELVAANLLRSGYHIADICIPASQVEPCGHSTLDVTFRRPDPDAYIRADGLSTLYESARVIFISPRSETQSVVVEQNGQISVQ